MDEFQSKRLVNLVRVIPVAFQVALNHVLQSLPFNVWSAQTAWVEQHLPNIPGKGVAVPDPEMERFVPSQEQAFEVKGRERVVYPGYPLRHSHVIRVLRLE